jgi:hypothetical protein
LKQTYRYELTIAEMWRVSDFIECLIFFALALMLVYTAFVTVRFFRIYLRVRRQPYSYAPDSVPDSQGSRKSLIAELSRGLGTLRSIASAAPFLGLAGTAYGILCLFFQGFTVSKWLSTAGIALEMSTALVATAAGLMVAIPAAISYNVLCTRLEKFEGNSSSTLLEATPRAYGFAQTLPLLRRFSGFPSFALIAAPIFAILVPLFALLLSPRISMGLPVRLLKIGVSDSESASIVIRVTRASASGPSKIYVNAKETPWNELGSTLRIQLKVRPHWIVYVAGEDNVPWADVANAIDIARGLYAKVVLVTARTPIESGNLPEAINKNKGKK